MRNAFYIAAFTVALGLLASCDDAVLTAPAPCASASGGEWEFLGLQDDSLAEVLTVSVSPNDPERILAGLLGRLFLSDDGGANWSLVLSAPGLFKDIAFVHEAPQTILAANGADIYRSDDNGYNWVSVGGAICTDPLTNVRAMARATDGTFFVAASGSGACPSTLYISSDYGTTWEDICAQQGAMCPGALLPISIGLDASDPQRLFVGSGFSGKVHRSLDGGLTWTFSETTQGGLVRAIVIDTNSPDVLYVAHGSGGVSQSLDGGESWALYDAGLPRGTSSGSLIQQPDFSALFVLETLNGSESAIWRRESSESSWSRIGIDGELLFFAGGLFIDTEDVLYVGSSGLWRRDLKIISSNEQGPCGP